MAYDYNTYHCPLSTCGHLPSNSAKFKIKQILLHFRILTGITRMIFKSKKTYSIKKVILNKKVMSVLTLVSSNN